MKHKGQIFGAVVEAIEAIGVTSGCLFAVNPEEFLHDDVHTSPGVSS